MGLIRAVAIVLAVLAFAGLVVVVVYVVDTLMLQGRATRAHKQWVRSVYQLYPSPEAPARRRRRGDR